MRERVMYLFFLLPLVVTGLALLASWLLLPVVHMERTVGHSMMLAFRGVTAGEGFLTVLINALLTMVHLRNVWAKGREAREDFGAFLVLITGFTALIVLLQWLTTACRSIRRLLPAAVQPQRCEGCGYDLSHVPASGRCSECGMATVDSLEAGRRRNATVRTLSEGARAWLQFSLQHVLGGWRSYERLLIRDGADLAERFSRQHLAAIGLGASLWVAVCMTVAVVDHVRRHRELDASLLTAGILMTILVGLAVFLAGWGVHRLVGSVVSSYWFLRRLLPAPGDAETVIALETPVLWVFCLFNGTLVTSILLYDDWITQSLGWRFWNVLLGMPSEPAFTLIGNAVLILCWMMRMHRALLAVRWANY